MAYEVVMSYHLHMPSYFLGTFTEYPCIATHKITFFDSFGNKEVIIRKSCPYRSTASCF